MLRAFKKICLNVGVFAAMLVVFLQSSPLIQTYFAKNVFAEVPLSIWWPLSGGVVNGTQPFKAVIDTKPLTEYQMFWQVDNGQLNGMSDNLNEAPHKEASVDLSGWNWRGSGPYTLNFIAKDLNGSLLAQKTIVIYTSQPSIPLPTATPLPTPVLLPTATNTTPNNNLGAESVFYINPNSPAKIQADSWRQSRPAEASLMDKIASQPTAYWLGNWTNNITTYVNAIVTAAHNKMAIPIFVVYNIPQRDCGSYSAGGSNSPNAYRTWIRAVASGIGEKKAIVILEPDATSNIDCLSSLDQQTRFTLLTDAVAVLKNKGAVVYIDAGHPGWIDPKVMVSRLQKAGIGEADGFSLNVSNFISTQDNITYGNLISSQLNDKHFVIDTSRNGNGPTTDYQWCNPKERALGIRPTTTTHNSLVDAYLWVKYPGESDGGCNGGPAAGAWWSEYALSLAQKTN